MKYLQLLCKPSEQDVIMQLDKFGLNALSIKPNATRFNDVIVWVENTKENYISVMQYFTFEHWLNPPFPTGSCLYYCETDNIGL